MEYSIHIPVIIRDNDDPDFVYLTAIKAPIYVALGLSLADYDCRAFCAAWNTLDRLVEVQTEPELQGRDWFIDETPGFSLLIDSLERPSRLSIKIENFDDAPVEIIEED